jgi:hypothetical protein
MDMAEPAAGIEYTLASNFYGSYCVPLSSAHRPAAKKILGGEVWEPETIQFLTSIRGDIVHAGTYFGDFLPALSASRVPGEKIFAFEPSRENFQCAQMTLRHSAMRRERASSMWAKRAGSRSAGRAACSPQTSKIR